MRHLYGYPAKLTVKVDHRSVDISDALTCSSDGIVALDQEKAIDLISQAERARCLTCGTILGQPKVCRIIGCTYNPRAAR